MRTRLWRVLLLCAWSTALGQSERALPDSGSLRVYTMPELVVTGSRNPMPVEYSPVRVELLSVEASPVGRSGTLAELLEEFSGIVQQYRIRSGIQMMGLDPAYTLILLNGQPLTGRVAGAIDLRRLPVGNIERIELVKGPMSSLYGSDALGGVINILTPRPRQGWSGMLRPQYTQRSGAQLDARIGYGGPRLSGLLYGGVHYSEPFTLRVDTLSYPYAGVTELQLQGSAYWTPSATLEAQADVRLFGSRSRGAFAEVFGNLIAVNHGAFEQQEWSSAVSASWTHRRARLQGGLFANEYQERYYWDTAATARLDNFLRRFARLWWQYDLLWRQRYRFTLGAELLYDDVQGERYPGTPHERTLSAFLQWEGTPYDWLSYALSLRTDATRTYGTHWSPKLALLLRPWGGQLLQLRASVGTGFRAPDFRQLYVRFQNLLSGAGYALLGARLLGRTLEPEQSLALDLSLLLPLNGWLQLPPESQATLELRAFSNWVRNLIEPYYVERREGVDIYSYRNLARIATRGIELTAAATLAPPDAWWLLRWRAGYQLLDAVDLEVLDAIAEGRAGTQDPTTGRFQPLRREQYGGLWGRSRHMLTLSLSGAVRQTDTWLHVRLLHRSRFGSEALDKNGVVISSPPRTVPDRDDEYVPGYWDIALRLEQRWRWQRIQFALSAGVKNLLNELNPQFLPHLRGRQWLLELESQW
jgi:outer membrane receptor for ferrienterochelin and colicins